jgi:hypothetical protein
MNAADQEIIGLLRAVLDKLEERIEGSAGPATLPPEDQLWDTADVAHYFKRTAHYVREACLPLPSFPKAIRLPSAGRARPLYIAAEVVAWAKKHKEKN